MGSKITNMTNKLNSLGTVIKVSEDGSRIQNSMPFNLFVKGYSIQQIQQGIKDSFGITLQTEELEYKIKRYHVEHRMQVSKQEIMAAQRSGMKNSQIQAMLHMKYGVYFTVAEIRQMIKEYKLKNRRKWHEEQSDTGYATYEIWSVLYSSRNKTDNKRV